MIPRRQSPEFTQERISRHQIEELFEASGWMTATPPDLGEDFVIHIYIDGRATGASFFVQAKSVTSISKLHKDANLVYSIPVKDIKHWGTFVSPVVLIVWDINQRDGRWALISDIIPELDKNRPNWRNNKTKVRVKIPWINTLSDKGLIQLKQTIGIQFYPLISRGRNFEMDAKFVFPNTSEGQVYLQAFERHIKEGEPVILKGKIIQELKVSEWWEKWFGEYDPETVQLQIGRISSQRIFNATIDIISNKGETSYIPNVEFQVEQAGTELIKINNHLQPIPMKFDITVRKSGTSTNGICTLAINGFSNSLDETLNMLHFLQGIADGGQLRITFAGFEDQPSIMKTEPYRDAAPDERLVGLVNKLIFIQKKTGKFLRIPQEGISPEEINTINELYEILSIGSITSTNGVATFEIKGEGIEITLELYRQSKPFHIELSAGDCSYELFGTIISVGPMKRSITGSIEMTTTEIEKAIVAVKSDQYIPIKVVCSTVTETFPNWTPKTIELSDQSIAA